MPPKVIIDAHLIEDRAISGDYNNVCIIIIKNLNYLLCGTNWGEVAIISMLPGFMSVSTVGYQVLGKAFQLPWCHLRFLPCLLCGGKNGFKTCF